MTDKWKPIGEPPAHRHDVLIRNADGKVGIGWFSQTTPPALNTMYIATGDMKPTLEQEVAAREITRWTEIPE